MIAQKSVIAGNSQNEQYHVIVFPSLTGTLDCQIAFKYRKGVLVDLCFPDLCLPLKGGPELVNGRFWETV